MDNNGYRELFLKMIRMMKIITSVFLGILMILVAALIVFYTLYNKQFQLPSYDFTLLFITTQFIILMATLVLSISFFRSYEKVVTTINDEDLENLKRMRESRFWLNKYFPPFIIYSGKIRVFKWLNQPEFYFSELKEIKIKSLFTRGKQNKLVIFKKPKGHSFFFAIDNNPIQQKHLFDKALEYNPNILIGDSRR